MSVDRSLRLKSSLSRHRNVLSRAERIALLRDSGLWAESRSALHLPKVGHRKAKAGKKSKKEEAPAAGGQAGAARAPGK
jgi:small basic protein (TIGR04137 family)